MGGCTSITTSSEGGEIQPVELVTVKVKVPDGILVMVIDVPEPVLVTAPGFLVIVHVPVEGRPLKIALPVEVAQVG